MTDGSGLPPMYPAIKDSPYLGSLSDQLPCLIRQGRQSKVMENVAMPATNLSPLDIANLINYMDYKFETESGLNIKRIESLLDECQ